MRFQVGDVVRVKKNHRHSHRNYGDGVVIALLNRDNYPCPIRVRWSIRPVGRWRELSLRLVRRPQ